MATTISASAVIAEFGAHYVDQGQNLQSLLQRPFEAFGTRDAFTNIPTTDTQLKFSDVTVSEVLQPYQDTFTEKGSQTFKPVTIDLQQVKVDQSFNPNSLVYSWLGFLTSNSTDRKTWPFTRWFIEAYLLKQVFEDLEKSVIYKGVKGAITPGTAGSAIAVMNGVEKLINDGITANKVTVINTGAPSTDPKTWCEQVENFVKGIPELYWDKPMTINMSRSLALRYAEGKDIKYNTHYAQENNVHTVKNFPSFTVKGRASMFGKTKIWATPVENAVFATKGFENANGFEMESVDRKVKVWTDFHVGAGFLLMDLVFSNDQNLPA